MSKDFTPKILYEVDKHIQNTQGHNLRDAVITRTIDGVTTRIDNNQFTNYAKRYPNLIFLYQDMPYLPYLDIEDNLKFLDSIEIELTEHLSDETCQDTHSVVQKWYFGLLDPNFYYNTHNNEQFKNWIVDNFIKS